AMPHQNLYRVIQTTKPDCSKPRITCTFPRIPLRFIQATVMRSKPICEFSRLAFTAPSLSRSET
ncbi:MAG: hypothetical protein ABW100_11975, partial [Candidatus Thiodiazotropha sp. 6PLUC3]